VPKTHRLDIIPARDRQTSHDGIDRAMQSVVRVIIITRSSADADKPARRVWRSVKVTKHSTIPYVRYSFLLCNSNFVFKTISFTIFDLTRSSADADNGLDAFSGQSRSTNMVPFWVHCDFSLSM